MKNERWLWIFTILFGGWVFILSAQPSKYSAIGKIHRFDPAVDQIIPKDAVLEKIAEGFEWSEGPVWIPGEECLLFSDIPRNTIYSWKESEGLRVYLRPAGYFSSNPPGKELGTNGLALDREGRLIMCDHGNRCLSRLNTENFTREILVDKYQGKRLNSPNDLVVKSNGDIYFTDPPYGLKGLNKSHLKELNFNGVYLLKTDGRLILLTKELTFPNGIGLSPDEKTLYVSVSDPQKPIWMAYDVRGDGTIHNGRIFNDAIEWQKQGKKGLPDGLTLDQTGNIFATGPGGVHIFSRDGKHLGLIETGEATSNCTFGDDGSTLFITVDMYLCRIRLNTKGIGF